MGVKQVHVSGVGVLGSFLLWELTNLKVPFTWDDAESPENAWEASVGAILPYPDKNKKPEAKGWRFWNGYRLTAPWFARHLSPVSVTYAFRAQPANLQPGKVASVGEPTPDRFRFWIGTAYRLNVQNFVRETREAFADSRIPGRPLPPADVMFQCHGVRDEVAKPMVTWSWSALVRVTPTELGKSFWTADSALRFGNPTLRTTSYSMFPTGAPGVWRVGGDWILTRSSRDESDRLVTRFASFRSAAERIWGAWLTFEFEEPTSGWSPEPRGKEWRRGPSVRTFEGGTIYIPQPVGISGVQCGPMLAWDLVCAAKLNTL